MAQDDYQQVAETTEFRQKLEAMVAAAEDAKKKAVVARTPVLAAIVLLEQEQRAAAQLDAAARAAVRLIEPLAPPSNRVPDNSSSSNPDDYEAAVIANLHLQASGVQNIRSLVSVVLDSSSVHYARWRENVLLTLRRYALADHVLSDDSFVDVPAWDMMDMLVKSWIFGTISPELQDVTRQCGLTARAAWLALENRFIGNRETRALHIEATFWNFVQGDLNVDDYYLRMKGFADSLIDHGVDVPDRVLVLNVLRGLSKNFDHLRAIFIHTTSFPSFQKVHDDLCLEEIQQGV
jgi:hypothetical protein